MKPGYIHTLFSLFVQSFQILHNTSIYTSHMRSPVYQRPHYSCAESALFRLTLLALELFVIGTCWYQHFSSRLPNVLGYTCGLVHCISTHVCFHGALMKQSFSNEACVHVIVFVALNKLRKKPFFLVGILLSVWVLGFS